MLRSMRGFERLEPETASSGPPGEGLRFNAPDAFRQDGEGAPLQARDRILQHEYEWTVRGLKRDFGRVNHAQIALFARGDMNAPILRPHVN